MDALVESLATSWKTGKKSLVFVRRVASVKELKRKLDECYDKWLQARLLRELPSSLHARLERLYVQYRQERAEVDSRQNKPETSNNGYPKEEVDGGGFDSFFAWFFRGDGPRGSD